MSNGVLFTASAASASSWFQLLRAKNHHCEVYRNQVFTEDVYRGREITVKWSGTLYRNLELVRRAVLPKIVLALKIFLGIRS